MYVAVITCLIQLFHSVCIQIHRTKDSSYIVQYIMYTVGVMCCTNAHCGGNQLMVHLMMVTTLSVAAKSRFCSTVSKSVDFNMLKTFKFTFQQPNIVKVKTGHVQSHKQSSSLVKFHIHSTAQHRIWLQYGYQITVNLQEEAWIGKLAIYQSTGTPPPTVIKENIL